MDSPYESSFNFTSETKTFEEAEKFVEKWMKEYERGYALLDDIELGRYFFQQTVEGDVVWNADGSVDRLWCWVNPEWSVRIYEVLE